MKYALIVPPGFRRRGGTGLRGDGRLRHYTRAQRMRILEVLRLQCNDPPPRVQTRAQRMRILEVLRLQAGLPVASSDTPLPRGRPEPIDLSQFDEDIAWMEARFHKRKNQFTAAGLREDGEGRVSCLACKEVLAASPWGMPTALHPRAMAYVHAFTCPGRTG